MSALDSAQLQYMRQVLGLDRVLMPQFAAQAAQAGEASAPELFQTSDLSLLKTAKFIAFFPLEARDFPLQGESESLVDKMIRAMKVNPSEVFFAQFVGVGAALSEMNFGGKPVVVFGEFEGATKGKWISWRGSKLLATHSPRELLESPDKKRLAWVHLQAVMKEF